MPRILMSCVSIIFWLLSSTVLAQQTDNAQLLRDISAAHASGAWRPTAGRGEAVVTFRQDAKRMDPACPTPDTTKTEMTYKRFAFLGGKQRVETYACDDNGARGALKSARIDLADSVLNYWPDAKEVGVSASNTSQWKSVVGDDFSPANLLDRSPHGDIGAFLETVASKYDNFAASSDKDGLLRITASKKPEGGGEWRVEVVLDPHHGYTVASYNVSNTREASDWSETYNVEWAEIGGTIYPKKAVWQQDWKFRGKDQKSYPDSHTVREVEFKTFDPAAPVSDADFTIYSFGAPPDTQVVDQIFDTVHKLGTVPEVTERGLAGELAETAAPTSTESSSPSPTPKRGTSRKDAQPKPQVSTTQPSAIGHSWFAAPAVIIVVALLVVLAVFLLSRRKKT